MRYCGAFACGWRIDDDPQVGSVLDRQRGVLEFDFSMRHVFSIRHVADALQAFA
jgi:hypothetical protein